MSEQEVTREPTVRVRTDEGESSVDLDQFERLIRSGEVGPDSVICFPLVTGDEWVAASELEIFRGLYSPDRIVFHEQFNLSRFPLVTIVIVAVNVVVFMAIQYAEIYYGAEAPLVLGAKAAPLIEEAGQLWRILTFSFVHADQLHLLANAGFLMLLGLALENAYSRWTYSLILLSSALVSGVASYLFTDSPAAGASGIVFGILGGLVVFGVKYRALIPRRYAYYFGWSVLPLLLITIYAGLAMPLVDHAGHVGGLVGGVVAGLVVRAELLEHTPSSRRAWVRTGAVLAAVLVVLIPLGPFLGRLAVRFATFEDDLGLRVTHPESWSERRYDELGNVLLRHEEYPYVSLTLGSIERPEARGATAALEERLRVEITEAEERGEVEQVEILKRGRFDADSHDGAMVTYTYASRNRRNYRELYVVTRGRLEHSVALRTLEVWRGPYSRVFGDVVDSLRLEEPSVELGGPLAQN